MSGKNWAIAIGINHYQNLHPLDYARGDAESVRDYFLQEVGFEKVYYFSEESPPIHDADSPIESRPTYGTLRRFLRVRFEQPFLGAGDNFWFFFAGHGIRENNRDYLMPIDGDPGDVEHTAISLNFIVERLSRCGADNVVLLLDACRSEGCRSGLGGGESRYPGIVTFYSCSHQESSYEIEELQQGAFTRVLLQGLRMQGEGNCATVERLSRYLQSNVPALVKHYKDRVQTPIAAVDPASKYHLILLPKLATVADTNVLRIDALTAEQKGDYQVAKELWTRVLVNVPGDSQAIEAIGRLASSRPQPITPPQASSMGSRSGVRSRLTRRRWLALMPLASVGMLLAIAVKKRFDFERIIQTIMSRDRSPLSEFEFETGTVNAKGEEIERTIGKANFFAEDLGNNIKLEMVDIPQGVFSMGRQDTERSNDDRDRPLRQAVTVQSFFIGKTPITQAQWRQVASFPRIQRPLNPNPSIFKGDDRPVERVSWYDAIEFCARLSQHTGQPYRLPSEAEWEYACRAKTTTPFAFGETITTDWANYKGKDVYASAPQGEYRQETTPIATFPPNAFGLYDMHGNVWEWCADPWHENYENNPPQDERVWDETHNRYQYLLENLTKFLKDNRGRVRRGGSWDTHPIDCRSAYRAFSKPNMPYQIVGFRVAVSVTNLEEYLQNKTLESSAIRGL